MSSILVAFAPVCRDLYIDICLKTIKHNPNIIVNGIFFEDEKIVNNCLKTIPQKNLGHIFNFKHDEIDLIYSKKQHSEKLFFDEDNIINKMISADRIAGSGYMKDVSYRSKYKYKKIFLENTDLPRNYCCNLYSYVNNILNLTNPKMIFVHSVGSALTLGFYYLAAKKNIKFLSPKHTRLKNYMIIDEYQIGSIKKVNEIYYKFNLNSVNNQFEEEAKNLYHQITTENLLPEYYQKHKNDKNKFSSIFFFLKGLKRNFKNLMRFQIDYYTFNSAFFDFYTSLKKNSFKWSKKLPTKYIYFPLHVDPEASTMVESYLYTDQLFIIELISKSMPGDYALLVKEHIPMLGLRDKIFYKKIQSLPNVRIIDPYVHPNKIIRNAKATIVITGTVSWESLCMGIPTIVFEKVPHLVIDKGIFYLKNIKDLRKTILLALKTKVNNKKEIINYISALLQTSFKMDTNFFWGNYLSYSNDEKKHGVKQIFEQIKKYL